MFSKNTIETCFVQNAKKFKRSKSMYFNSKGYYYKFYIYKNHGT